MYGALLLFESEFVHVVAISFTSLILTELLMVALTVRTWHWLMVLAEFFSLGAYLASLAFLNEYFGKQRRSPVWGNGERRAGCSHSNRRVTVFFFFTFKDRGLL